MPIIRSQEDYSLGNINQSSRCRILAASEKIMVIDRATGRMIIFSVLDSFKRICADVEITPVNAAFSWLINHSNLSAELGDGIILSVSKVSQLTDNLSAFNQGPLNASILKVLDRGWEVIRPNCFRYFRP
jgi:aryl-alcohol dehydrogenase-like predicted oxidoreductase